jgi:hypothetical protein
MVPAPTLAPPYGALRLIDQPDDFEAGIVHLCQVWQTRRQTTRGAAQHSAPCRTEAVRGLAVDQLRARSLPVRDRRDTRSLATQGRGGVSKTTRACSSSPVGCCGIGAMMASQGCMSRLDEPVRSAVMAATRGAREAARWPHT